MNVKLISENAKMPTRGSIGSAGWDLYAAEDATILSGANTLVSTDLVVEVPFGYFGGIFARSGLSVKEGLRPANCVGVIDSDYRGTVQVALYNDSPETKEIHVGDRIAQFILIPYSKEPLFEVNEITNTERGDGGFGSTGSR